MASNQEAGNQRFDTEAATWDSNKKHVESCDMAVEAIKRHISAFGDGSSKSENARLYITETCSNTYQISTFWSWDVEQVLFPSKSHPSSDR